MTLPLVTWLEYCQTGRKSQSINQSISINLSIYINQSINLNCIFLIVSIASSRDRKHLQTFLFQEKFSQKYRICSGSHTVCFTYALLQMSGSLRRSPDQNSFLCCCYLSWKKINICSILISELDVSGNLKSNLNLSNKCSENFSLRRTSF